MNIPLGINNVTCRNRADEPMTFAVFSSLSALIAGAAPNVRSTVYGVAGCDLMRTEDDGPVSGSVGRGPRAWAMLAVLSSAELALIDSDAFDVRPFTTLSLLLSTAPKPGMRATAVDAPGSMLFEVGGKWGGYAGVFADLLTLTAAMLALAPGSTGTTAAGVAYIVTASGAIAAIGGGGSTSSTVYDVVVFGATPGGIMAAIRAARCGASVALVEPEEKIGGMVTGGIQYTDLAVGYSTSMICGLADEFYDRICGYYAGYKTKLKLMRNTQYYTELWVADRFLKSMLADAKIVPVVNAQLVSVAVGGGKITSVTTTAGTFYGKTFVDGTYELDLLGNAGCTVSIGRESTALYSEAGAGVTASSTVAIDPYIIPGDSNSGLIYGVEAVLPGAVGTADTRCQAITYRVPLSTNGSAVITQPPDYDASKYEALGRLAALSGSGWTKITDACVLYQSRNAQLDLNSKGIVMSTNWIGPETTEWLTASYTRRAEIAAMVKSWIKGLLWFLQTDARIPVAMRTNVATYKWASKEFIDTDNFPTQVYIREGRRLVGDYVLTLSNISTDNNYADPIAFAYYPPDGHYCRRYAQGGGVKMEGFVAGVQPPVSKIPMRVLFPKSSEITNAVATFGVSASRAAFMSIRVEPTHMSIGDFAGAVVAMAAARGIPVQSVAYADVVPSTGFGKFFPSRPGDCLLYADNSRTADGNVTRAGTWTNDANPYLTSPCKVYRSTDAAATAKFAPTVGTTGKYSVYLKWPINGVTGTFSTVTPVTVVSAEGAMTFTLNQTGSDDGNSGDWEFLGEFTFAAGAPSAHYVQIAPDGTGTTTSVIAAVLFRKTLD